MNNTVGNNNVFTAIGAYTVYYGIYKKLVYSNGFTINKEIAVSERDRYYIALDAYYTGEVKEYTLSDCFLGKLPETAEAKAYLKKQFDRYERRYNALKKRGENVHDLEVLINDLKGFIYG